MWQRRFYENPTPLSNTYVQREKHVKVPGIPGAVPVKYNGGIVWRGLNLVWRLPKRLKSARSPTAWAAKVRMEPLHCPVHLQEWRAVVKAEFWEHHKSCYMLPMSCQPAGNSTSFLLFSLGRRLASVHCPIN